MSPLGSAATLVVALGVYTVGVVVAARRALKRRNTRRGDSRARNGGFE
ncbi:MAG: hypothetical protein Q7K37_06190 [Dehalococcoidia bacterium]|nr:hypothetical protein [Dehalococcoidia bacterium]